MSMTTRVNAMSMLFRDPQQFLNGCPSFNHLLQAVLVQVAHAALDRLLLDVVEVRLLADQRPQRVAYQQQLENPRAAMIPRGAAVIARRLCLLHLAVAA